MATRQAPKVYITRKVQFNAAHRLYNSNWSEAENRRVFGKCMSPNFHGHNFEMEVTLAGAPDPQTGFVFDLAQLKEIINEQIVEAIDHKNLNLDVPFLQDVMPSTENLAVKVWERLAPHVKPAEIYSIHIQETPNNSVIYYGETIEEPTNGASTAAEALPAEAANGHDAGFSA